MADNESFLRKVVRFVANPATDWADLSSRQPDSRELELEKTELKAMIERKRRNDFVRKREFDMLRRIRREGLSPEQLAALGSSSRLDDTDARLPEPATRPEPAVKAKIDEIEQQMAGETGLSGQRRPASFYEAPTEPATVPASQLGPDDDRLPTLPMMPGPAAPSPTGPDELVHDPELDEAVIAFANADFQQCERLLQQLTSPDGSRSRHAATWRVRLDLYRATGQHERFDALASDYAQRFGGPAPPWYSLPERVADAVAQEQAGGEMPPEGELGWACPQRLDVEAVSRLQSQALQMPQPWVFDWGALRTVDPEAASHLTQLLRLWAEQSIEMRWLRGERLLEALQEAAPTGARQADPAYWLARLEALRLANRAADFDQEAIDYCLTYEASPPPWAPARCRVHTGEAGQSTRTPELSVVGEVSRSFQDTGLDDDAPAQEVAQVELSGQLVGDIGQTLARIGASLGRATVVRVSCARLIRVDFVAAGELLNWVLGRHQEGRRVQFVDAHRLVALFFGAMGIGEHASVGPSPG